MPNDSLSLHGIIYLLSVNASPSDFKCYVGNL